jgi:hypothetical protein
MVYKDVMRDDTLKQVISDTIPPKKNHGGEKFHLARRHTIVRKEE